MTKLAHIDACRGAFRSPPAPLRFAFRNESTTSWGCTYAPAPKPMRQPLTFTMQTSI